ncbi:MAG: Sec-independent protein translocase protein TatB [bacterium]
MNIGGPELLFIALIALVVFGPKRLPEVVRDVAKIWRQIQRYSTDLRREFQSALHELELDDASLSRVVEEPPSGYDPVTHSVPYAPPVFDGSEVPEGGWPSPSTIEVIAEPEPETESEPDAEAGPRSMAEAES